MFTEVVLLVGDVLVFFVELDAGVDGVLHPLVVANIEDAGVSFCFRLPGLGIVLLREAGDFGFRVVKVAKDEGVGRAVLDTGGVEADISAVATEVTLLGDFFFGVDRDGSVGAGIDAFLLEVAAAFIDVDAAIFLAADCFGWTCFEAGGVHAVHTDEGSEDDFLIFRLFEVANSHAEVAKRDFVFCLARY